ncbi:MAG: pitrilysin family protein [Syntrophales bacterium]|nr:pitrilysin family protein [Syntrophales bacterium]
MAEYIPEIHQATLPNGLTLLGVEYDRVPWLSLTFMAKRGAEADPPGKGGVADWTADFLTLGTETRSQLQLAADIEARGASLSARGGWDATLVSLEGLAEDLPELMATLAEVVQTPAFPEDEFPLLKERRRAELAHLLDDPREFANRRFTRLLLGNSPYGHPLSGDLESLEAIRLQDLQDFYHREFAPGESTLVVVGMAPFARMREEAEKSWAAWSGGGPASPPYTQVPEGLRAPGLYLVDRADLTQSEIRLGHLGLPRSHPDYYPLRLVNYILGEGGFSSRLMTRIRSDLGCTYGIRSSFNFRRAPGPFVVSTFTPAAQTGLVVKEIKAVMQEVKEGGITAQELAEAQSYYVGHFPLGLETPRGIGSRVVSMDLYNLGPDYLKRHRERIQEVTLAAAQDAALKHLQPDSLVALVVGPASQCAADLKALGTLEIVSGN